MKSIIPASSPFHRTVALLLCLFTLLWPGGSLSTRAQGTYQTSASDFVTLIQGQNFPVTSPIKYNAVELYTAGSNTLYVDEDVSIQSGGLQLIFSSMTWDATSRVSAVLLGCDEFTTPITGRKLYIQNMALTNVDLNTANVQVGFKPASGTSSLTLVNSSITGDLTPSLYSPVTFNLNAIGTALITNWSGSMSSVTRLNIASGGSLRIKNCGNVASISYTDMFYFDQFNNTALIDGASLVIEQSAVAFGKQPAGDLSKQSTMTFSNNATLQLTGYGSKLESDNLVFQNSTLTLAGNTHLTGRAAGTLELDNSSAVIGGGAEAHAERIIATNTAVVSLGIYGHQNSSFLDIKEGATMNVVGNDYDIGEMSVGGAVLFPTNGVGTLTVGDHAVFIMTGLGLLDLTSHARLSTTSLGEVDLQEGRMFIRQGSAFTNNGVLNIQTISALGIDGNITIEGAGEVDVNGLLTFTNASTLAQNSMTILNAVNLNSGSKLQMTLDPTGLTSDRLLLSSGNKFFSIDTQATLNLKVVNDTRLAPGTKFLLIDYPDWQVNMASHFKDLPDGATFTLGLNVYKILYNDPDYQQGNSTYITLTAVGTEVSAIVSPVKGGFVTGGGLYVIGTNVQLTAVASNGWQFTGWNTGATNNPYTITIPATNITYTATFALRPAQAFFQEAGGLVTSWLLDTNGTFQASRQLGSAGDWQLMAAGDMDGDGISDLLFQTSAGAAAGWFLNADGSIRSVINWGNIGSWKVRACADVLAEGHAQIFFQNPEGITALWHINTNGNFQSAELLLTNASAWRLSAAIPHASDGRADLYWQTPAGLVSVWQQQPGGGLLAQFVHDAGGWKLCGATDIDGDGVGDLLWQTADGTPAGWFVNSNNTMRAAMFWWNTAGWELKAAGR